MCAINDECTIESFWERRLVPESTMCDHGGAIVVNSDRHLNFRPFDPAKCELTEDRMRKARKCSFTTLNRDELTKLQDEQQSILHEDKKYSHDKIVKDAEKEEKARAGIRKLREVMIRTMLRARVEKDDALGFLDEEEEKGKSTGVYNSILMGPMFGAKLSESLISDLDVTDKAKVDDAPPHDALYCRRITAARSVVENHLFDVQDTSYVRKPDISKLVQQRDLSYRRRHKYSLRNLLTSRRFHLYKHRFANAQYKRQLYYPTLPQPTDTSDAGTEKERKRRHGHRFVIAADTQFGILMDGYAMENPNWTDEIEMSRRAVSKLNAMEGRERPLFVCVCGDLVDTESSFSGALASWKKVMEGWERTLVFEQQVKDFKRVWSRLDPDIGLVCLCGNHDVGNRPTRASIERWTKSLGDDYLAFWVNGTYNIAMNNCLFSNPTGAPDLFEEQLHWLEDRLIYAQKNNAAHIFVYSHFPWFLKHENETDAEVCTYSAAPKGWGPEGTMFPDNYFTIPIEERQIALLLFEKYGVTACFSGHFHQNVIAKSSWGMDMIVTGPLSMNLESGMSTELSKGEINGIGMRVVDVGEPGEFTHKWCLLDEDEANK
eukprot:CAMPEP_0172509266 /NCGR_PEP_ID=MMETSP1066-20121228/218816_1 /TAXON_ID=671091 /ORGANISM="Coscinodiscus wailesii, Strain CCMP2513" /LENGTH=602 /DNA_ID=CAMNT_0013287663 /DNA_START=162 /DNA_END=1970 /DNA_ORIENTATION=+